MPPNLRLRRASRRAANAAMGQGMWLPARPGDEMPDLPHDVTELDDSALMTLFGQYTQWLEFVGVQLAAAEIDEAAARDALERYKSIGLLNHSEGSKTVTAAKAKALSSPEYEELSDKYNEAHAYRKIITAMYESTEHKQRFVSRELSRRIGRADTDRREGRWAA